MLKFERALTFSLCEFSGARIFSTCPRGSRATHPPRNLRAVR